MRLQCLGSSRPLALELTRNLGEQIAQLVDSTGMSNDVATTGCVSRRVRLGDAATASRSTADGTLTTWPVLPRSYAKPCKTPGATIQAAGAVSAWVTPSKVATTEPLSRRLN